MRSHEYELTVIVRPDLEDSDTNAVIEKLEAVIETEGTMLLRDDWGKRKLAYAINKHLKGHYMLLSFAAPASLVIEIERRIRLSDKIIRFLHVKIADDVNVDERVEAAEVIKKQRDEEAAARAAADAAATAASEAAEVYKAETAAAAAATAAAAAVVASASAEAQA
ncbi:MAG: 30S ribosomal protein S6 [Rhodobacterales bacterium]|nr:30S ribosomal protein S6 [Rhodobacterales bacterium]